MAQGILHSYAKRLNAFQYGTAPLSDKNLLLFIGGLGDGFLSVDYCSTLATKLANNWALVQLGLSSSGPGWGTSSLQHDVAEISEAVTYFRHIILAQGKVVIMGHSTGCQDAMEYVIGRGKESRARINGVILQAPVSDREGLAEDKTEYDAVVNLAQEYIRTGRQDETVPLQYGRTLFGNTPVTAYRTLSLLSPNHDGDDDYFSSDLPPKRLEETFGAFPPTVPLVILCSGDDEHVPESVNVTALIERWIAAVRAGDGVVDNENSGIIPGATHNLNDNPTMPITALLSIVCNFLVKIENGLDEN